LPPGSGLASGLVGGVARLPDWRVGWPRAGPVREGLSELHGRASPHGYPAHLAAVEEAHPLAVAREEETAGVVGPRYLDVLARVEAAQPHSELPVDADRVGHGAAVGRDRHRVVADVLADEHPLRGDDAQLG